MAKHLQRDASGHLMKRGEADDHLANGCAPILCDDCKANGPITATITTTGSCEVDPGTCIDYCNNGVVSLAWNGTNWFGTLSDATRDWTVAVYCGTPAPANTWRIDVTGGCFEGPPQPSVWVKSFVPEGCELDGADGYPTHSGINMGAPTAAFCDDDCVPTVALS